MQTLRQSSQGDQQAALQKFQAARQKSEGEAETVLTSEQKTQWTALKTENEQFQGLGRAGVALAGVEALTDDQKGKLKTLAEETGGKRRTVFQDAVQGGDRAAAREKIQALETESDAAVRKLLTADQVKQYDATLAGLPRLGQRRPGNN